MGCLESREVTTRKPHQCRVCGDKIQAGEKCFFYKGVEYGIGFYTLYFHNDCFEYSRSWDFTDWESYTPGDISHDEVVEAMQ